VQINEPWKKSMGRPHKRWLDEGRRGTQKDGEKFDSGGKTVKYIRTEYQSGDSENGLKIITTK